MQCPQCLHGNPDGSRFCNGCGAKLDGTCSACAHVNPLGSRFCNACGHHLVAPSSTQPETQAGTEAELSPIEPSLPEAERRQLTVMFCDLVGSTHLSGQLDPEDLREVVRAYQTACTDVIQRYDGHVAQLLGDGLLVYFGYPVAHEDAAQRSVLTGLGILDAIQTLNTHLEPAKGIKLAIRLGIHTGLVWWVRWEGKVGRSRWLWVRFPMSAHVCKGWLNPTRSSFLHRPTDWFRAISIARNWVNRRSKVLLSP